MYRVQESMGCCTLLDIAQYAGIAQWVDKHRQENYSHINGNNLFINPVFASVDFSIDALFSLQADDRGSALGSTTLALTVFAHM